MPGRGPLPRPILVSKKLSWLLRHGAAQEKLTLSPQGYANLASVLNTRTLRQLKATFEEVQTIVAENDKQRFALVPAPEGEQGDGEAGKWLIRANQGHSVKVESEGLLEPVTLEGQLPEMAVHGTTHAAWTTIVASGGLKPMGRNHVHLASGLPKGFASVKSAEGADKGAEKEAPPVISGMRSSSTVLVFVDLKRSLEAGVKFWKSENGVILTAGNEEGVLPLELFEKTEDRTGEGVLVEDGKVIKEAPESWKKGDQKPKGGQRQKQKGDKVSKENGAQQPEHAAG